jgi:hypothetical protein
MQECKSLCLLTDMCMLILLDKLSVSLKNYSVLKILERGEGKTIFVQNRHGLVIFSESKRQHLII